MIAVARGLSCSLSNGRPRNIASLHFTRHRRIDILSFSPPYYVICFQLDHNYRFLSLTLLFVLSAVRRDYEVYFCKRGESLFLKGIADIS